MRLTPGRPESKIGLHDLNRHARADRSPALGRVGAHREMCDVHTARIHLRNVDLGFDARGIELQISVPQAFHLHDHGSDQRPHVHPTPDRFEDPAGEPVEIQEVLQQALELEGVPPEPTNQFVLHLDGERGAVALQRERVPEDRGQWGAQLM